MLIPYFTIVRTKQVAVVEAMGKFSRIIAAGPKLILPWESVVGRLSLKVKEMQVSVETKTLDDVFVKLLIAVQYQVIPQRAKEAFYELSDPLQQIESYVFDEVRSTVPNMNLDEVFRNKERIAAEVKKNLQETMEKYGFGIIGALVNDIEPDAKVKDAMNEINAALRMRKAAEEKANAEKILIVKKAEADAESNVLHGKGIAGQRKAIVDGLRESVEGFQSGVAGATTEDILHLILLTQYFDMLKEVGATSRATTILLPHSPGGLQSVLDQLRESVAIGNEVSKSTPARRPTPPGA
jgi:regulator of protease activity HflC (stomatin/prohibitin superfamily)